MLGASFLPARLRASDGGAHARAGQPSWLGRRINPFLLGLSNRACTHPIYTIVSVAVLASTTYLGLLESSLLDRSALGSLAGAADFEGLLVGSKRLYTGPDNGWKWHVEDNGHDKVVDDVSSGSTATILAFSNHST
jgi:hydroxymethylglutaryl-CoA reductase (NADPH)